MHAFRRIVLVAFTLAAGVAGVASAAPRVTIPEDACTGEQVSRPDYWQSGCGSCNTFFARASWSRWGGTTARGTATMRRVRPTGSDSCASAYEKAPLRRVTVTLSGRRNCGQGLQYTILTVSRGGRRLFVDRSSLRCV